MPVTLVITFILVILLGLKAFHNQFAGTEDILSITKTK